MRYRKNRKTGDLISEIGIGSSYMYEAGRKDERYARRVGQIEFALGVALLVSGIVLFLFI